MQMKHVIAILLIPVIIFFEAGILYKLIQWFFEFNFTYTNCMGVIAIWSLFKGKISNENKEIEEILEDEIKLIAVLGLFFILMFLIYSIL